MSSLNVFIIKKVNTNVSQNSTLMTAPFAMLFNTDWQYDMKNCNTKSTDSNTIFRKLRYLFYFTFTGDELFITF